MSKTCRELVLIIENHKDTAELICVALELEGIQSKVSNSAISALTKLQTLSPDLILINIHLKDRDGYQLVHYLDQTSLSKDCPVLMYSSNPRELIDVGRSNRIHGIIQNIVDIDDLGHQVKKHLQLDTNSGLPIKSTRRLSYRSR